MTEPDDISGEFKHELREVIKLKEINTLDELIKYAENKGFRRKHNQNLELTKKQKKLMAKVLNKYGDEEQKKSIIRKETVIIYNKPRIIYRDTISGKFVTEKGTFKPKEKARYKKTHEKSK